MQGKPRFHILLLIALVASLALGACSGGANGQGSTWFNLPSLPLQVQEDGTAKVFGFTTRPLLQPALVQQLQAANVQKLEIRLGYNGIHVYANGEDLPYIAWDDESIGNLRELLPRLPQVPNGALIARFIGLPRRVGIGVALKLPVAPGATPLDIPAWQGETAVSPETGDLGDLNTPIIQAGLVYDKSGVPAVDGILISELEKALGAALPLTLDPNTMAIIDALDVEKLEVTTHPNGINLTLNGKPLPGIAYDQEYLSRAINLAGPFLPTPALGQLLQDEIIPLVPGADVNFTVVFGNESVAAVSQ